ncbi:hypothetical protein B484DRAFT_277035 [Ochromonadaceae sp. CCMP2298]|nr:hypothetical protein B484DRAFT_292311 [Ochromonadaceae sp. CCMP2298]KAJ1443795.1 hypothetical protein B484DRAFT_277035 [Ochromonadaceae sp. CCMP2298]
MYKPLVEPSTTRCDYVINDTVLAYSHDDIQNLGHSMTDFMNVWAMLWLSSMGPYSKDVTFLNIDAIRQGHSYNDQLGKFGKHYETAFARILTAKDFASRGKPTVCFKRLIMQPRPLVLFTWDGWWQDMKCTFMGPSSLFQRWNIQIRNNYGLLNRPSSPTNKGVRVLLLVRSASSAAQMQQSRVFTNPEEIIAGLKEIQGASLRVQDLSQLSFEEQVTLVADSSVIIGVHGAGIPASMHMSVGTTYCCGVLEIFPEGEFKAIRGYGNMARRMGHHYERLALTGKERRPGGTNVPANLVVDRVRKLIAQIQEQPSCVMPNVVSDQHFTSVPSVWG